MTLERAKASLDGNASLLDAAFDAGLSGPGRLHDLFVTYEAMTPGDYKRGGTGMEIRWAWCDGPFGETLLMVAPRGLCGPGVLGCTGAGCVFSRYGGSLARREPD